MSGATAWTTTPVARLEIPRIHVADGPHGVRRFGGSKSLGYETLAATCFPTASCLASSWNLDLMYELGQAIAAGPLPWMWISYWGQAST